MLCNNCKKRQASVHVTRVVSGKKVEQHLCPICASEVGLTMEDLDFPGFFEFPDLFASFFKKGV